MRPLLALCALAWMSTALAAGLSDPVAWLQGQRLVTDARFELAHATYSVWRLRWGKQKVPLQLVFASNATTPAQAGQLRELTVTTYAPDARHFSAAQRAVLLDAARRLSAQCALNVPRGAPEAGEGNTAPAEARQLSYTVALPADHAPRCLTPVPR